MKKVKTLVALILGLSLAFISCKSGSDSGSGNEMGGGGAGNNFDYLIGTWTITDFNATSSVNGGTPISIPLSTLQAQLESGDFRDTMDITQNNLQEYKDSFSSMTGTETAMPSSVLQELNTESNGVIVYNEIKYNNTYTVNEDKNVITITGSSTTDITVSGTQQRTVLNYTITYTKQQ